MALKLDIPQAQIGKPKITIFGVGGAGGNAINNMIRSNLEGVEFAALNTDAQALSHSLAQNKIQLGLSTTKGLGAGSFPDRGRVAAEENIDEIESLLEGNNMIFIAAGMGGGTGTGAAPVIAKLAREKEILTVGVVTKPFHFEGKYRMEAAERGIEELKKYVDTLIVIPNQNLFRIANEHTTFESAFKMADDVLHAGVRGITDLITMPGLVNLDFADIRTIMTKMGKAMMGTGEAEGENRAIEACEAAISNPLLDDISIKGAKGVLVNMTGGPDMTLFEADMAVSTIKREVDANANIIFGSAFNEDMVGRIRISVVATGIDEEEYKQDILKTPQIVEPSKFRATITKTETKKPVHQEAVSNAVNKTFFDPGLAMEIEEEAKLSEEDFPSKKSPKKEESKAKSAKKSSKFWDEVEEENDTEEKFDNFKEENFYDIEETVQEIHDDFGNEEIIVTRKTKINSEPYAKINEKPQKKESSGFSLFSFMNSKNKNELDHIEPKKSKQTTEFEEEEIQFRARQKQRISEEKMQEASKKKQEFFGSTIFDEEKHESKDNTQDDDILNVPAFFRRKK